MQRLRLFLPLIGFAVLAVLLWRGLALDPNHMPSALANRPFPEFTALTLDGRPVGRADLLGRPALVNVWATWCPSCATEHAFLNRLAADGVTIYGIDYKDDADAARRWIAERGNPYRLIVADPDGRLGIDLGVTGAPETYLIDADGVVRQRYQGALDQRVWQREFAPLFERLAAERPR